MSVQGIKHGAAVEYLYEEVVRHVDVPVGRLVICGARPQREVRPGVCPLGFFAFISLLAESVELYDEAISAEAVADDDDATSPVSAIGAFPTIRATAATAAASVRLARKAGYVS